MTRRLSPAQGTWLIGCIGLLGMSTLPAQADSIDISGQAIWEGCGYCHGIEGISGNGRFPHLAGQRPEYLRQQLQDFAAGARHNDDNIMQAQAAALSNEDIASVVAYFASSKPPGASPLPGTKSPGSYAATRELLSQGDPRRGIPGCTSCHGADAQGVAGIPALSSQQSAYLQKQLDDFASGQRGTAADVMTTIATKLTPTERRNLSEVLAAMARSSSPSITAAAPDAQPVHFKP